MRDILIRHTLKTYILATQITTYLLKLTTKDLYNCGLTPKNIKKSDSTYTRPTQINHLKRVNGLCRRRLKLQLLFATQTSIRPCQGQHYRHDIACLEQEFYFAPHRVWFKSDGHSLVAVKTILPILKYILLLLTKTKIIYKNRIYVVPYFKTVNTLLLLFLASAYSSSLYSKKISLSEPPPPLTTPPPFRTPSPAASAPPRCLLYTSPSPRDGLLSRMPSSA